MKIKWVNDIYLEGKKVCGILCEAVENSVIIGIGINLLPPKDGFPQSAGTAGAIGKDISPEQLLSTLIPLLLRWIQSENATEMLTYYRKKMLLTGKKVLCHSASGDKSGTVLGVSDTGALLIKDESGQITPISTGEIQKVIY